jgi:hypothetical protein
MQIARRVPVFFLNYVNYANSVCSYIAVIATSKHTFFIWHFLLSAAQPQRTLFFVYFLFLFRNARENYLLYKSFVQPNMRFDL